MIIYMMFYDTQNQSETGGRDNTCFLFYAKMLGDMFGYVFVMHFAVYPAAYISVILYPYTLKVHF